jgi:hypothetical protein
MSCIPRIASLEAGAALYMSMSWNLNGTVLDVVHCEIIMMLDIPNSNHQIPNYL